jgi:osmotically-inducible protein OsmY
MTDKQLRQNVENALEWEPSIDGAKIAVTADNGAVTLRGEVKTFAERASAERVSLRVYGVKAVANDIAVRPISTSARSDSDLAAAIVTALRWNTQVPADRIVATVADGWVTLKGEVEWHFQREAAERSVRDLAGVIGVTNSVTIKPHVRIADVQTKIEAALKRSAEIDARRIHVAALDGKVTLTGNVHSWAERREATLAAWAAPGVHEVDNRLSVVP